MFQFCYQIWSLGLNVIDAFSSFQKKFCYLQLVQNQQHFSQQYLNLSVTENASLHEQFLSCKDIRQKIMQEIIEK